VGGNSERSRKKRKRKITPSTSIICFQLSEGKKERTPRRGDERINTQYPLFQQRGEIKGLLWRGEKREKRRGTNNFFTPITFLARRRKDGAVTLE